MKTNVQEIVWMVEEKVMHAKSFNNFAVRLFRDQGCLRDDFRTVLIVEATFDILTKAFVKDVGRTNLTKTLAKVGQMIALQFSIEASTSTAVQLGNLIVDQMITANYLILTQEPFFTLEDIVYHGKKETVRSKGYILEYGPEFDTPKRENKCRRGIKPQKYPIWKGSSRTSDGLQYQLAKYYGDTPQIDGDEAFLKAVNSLEQVKWEVNPNVTKVSDLLQKDIVNYVIKLDKGVKFDVRDIKREKANKRLAGKDLYLNGSIFRPDKGNPLTVETLEKELTRLNRRINSLADGGKTQLKALEENRLVTRHFEKHNNWWAAKQLCLATRSKVTRDQSILETILDWSGYQFYMAMFLDFRGRMYSTEPFFSYQGSDLARGHLMFAEKKVMTDSGYKHLLVHAANSFNQSYTIKELDQLDYLTVDYKTDLVTDGIPDMAVDKMAKADRILWAEDNLTLFLDIAEDPIATKDIWMGAEKPWVFLSLCYEIVGYLFAEGDYLSQIPIAIDGSSNGTQHLAAMSRDEVAGAMVGLVKQIKPVDFYIEVAKGILNRNVGTDLGKLLANIPMKLIRKGITKRGTMTRAYDAGVKCISDIIYTDCYNAGMNVKYGITKNIAFDLAKDLVEAYKTLCSGPVAVKDYLQALVLHQLETDDLITWTTPSEFPVVSEKWLYNKSKVMVYLQGKRCGLIIRENTGVPARAEIISGISPNYVHSMDASHMAMVINALNLMGITSFGAIHDSFSVHADDVDVLLDTTKEMFIKLYENDTFNHMAKHITKNDTCIPIIPPKLGKLDLLSIWDSDDFFS